MGLIRISDTWPPSWTNAAVIYFEQKILQVRLGCKPAILAQWPIEVHRRLSEPWRGGGWTMDHFSEILSHFLFHDDLNPVLKHTKSTIIWRLL